MVASPDSKPVRAWWRRGVYLLLGIPMAGAWACWWLTAPLADDAPGGNLAPAGPAAHPEPVVGPSEPARLEWPDGRLEGDAANRLLLDTLLRARETLETVDDYTATFRKQERINGVLGPEQTLEMKIRQHPFAVYFRYLAPQAGKEVVYAEGHHENKIIAHSGGLARLLVPRLAIAPDNPLALADTRHPITEAGLAHLLDTLIGFRRMDIGDPEAVTVLDRTLDAAGHPRLRSVHVHLNFRSMRPFKRVEVLYDPETRLPVEIHSYDWPRSGQEGDLLLAEHYLYENLNLDANLSALDFDPANPAYAFHRY